MQKEANIAYEVLFCLFSYVCYASFVMAFAIIQTGGKQYRVKDGEAIYIEKLEAKEGEKVTFSEVLLVDDGKEVKVGTPHVSGASVEGVVEEAGKDDKVTVIKYKAKSRYFKKRGHRQPYLKVKISKIA